MKYCSNENHFQLDVNNTVSNFGSISDATPNHKIKRSERSVKVCFFPAAFILFGAASKVYFLVDLFWLCLRTGGPFFRMLRVAAKSRYSWGDKHQGVVKAATLTDFKMHPASLIAQPCESPEPSLEVRRLSAVFTRL